MKKVISILAVLVLAACSDNKSPADIGSTSTPSPAPMTQQAEKPEAQNLPTIIPEVSDDVGVAPLKKGMVRYAGDYGCDSYRTQVARLQYMAIAFKASMAKNTGNETPETKEAGEMAAQGIVGLSKSNCRPLSGDYRIVSKRSIAGGHAVQIQFDSNTKLWVLDN